MPAISVVIPTHNRRDFVLRALESVHRQSVAPREIVVIDDGSTDGTMDAIQQHFPAVLVHSQAQSGVSKSRNEGIKRTTSPWIALLDSDDYWHPEKLAQQIRHADAHPNTRLIHCNEQWIRNGQPLAQKHYHRKSGGDIFSRSLHRCLISPSAVLLKRSLLWEVGPFDENMPACEDYDLWLRISAHEHVGFVDEALLTKHGGHGDQLSRTIWGLDRFRIYALRKLIFSNRLTAQQMHEAIAVLIKKIDIFVKGAEKHGRKHEISSYLTLAREVKQLCL
ncbi:MAG: glycosyltransferase [Pseudomonadota bacterium]